MMMDNKAKVLAYLKDREDELTQLTRDLIGIPTPNPPGDNYGAFSGFLKHWLTDAGLHADIVTPTAEELPGLLRPEMKGQRYAVLGRLAGAADHPAICFQGHYDTVQASEDWEFDPYTPILKNGKLYGLGATDMKGGLASMLMAAKALAKNEINLSGSVYFLATPDEEFPSQAGLAYFLKKNIVTPDYVIVGEPSGRHNIYIGMKGGIWGDLIVKGRAIHGSQPFNGVNAFDKMVDVAGSIKSEFIPQLDQRISRYQFRPAQGNHPTLTLGGIVGGTNASRAMVPDKCTVSFDRRLIPEETLEEAETELAAFLTALQTEDENLRIETEISSKAESMITPESEQICQAISKTIHQLGNKRPACTVACGGFETAMFVKRGIQAITYGPGAEDCAHAAGEYTHVSDLLFTAQVYALTAIELLA